MYSEAYHKELQRQIRKWRDSSYRDSKGNVDFERTGKFKADHKLLEKVESEWLAKDEEIDFISYGDWAKKNKEELKETENMVWEKNKL
jgi:hypothetical protein